MNRLCVRLLAVLVVSLLTLPGCASYFRGVTNHDDVKGELLAEKPFEFPAEFPLPKDADMNASNAWGDPNTEFETSLTIPDILSFYRKQLTSRGFTEDTERMEVRSHFLSVIFWGWPDAHKLIIQATPAFLSPLPRASGRKGKWRVNVRLVD